jgi:viroplasmin and RNaseH domain-containing protein
MAKQYALDIHIRMDKETLPITYDYKIHSSWKHFKNGIKSDQNRYILCKPWEFGQFMKLWTNNIKIINSTAPSKEWKYDNKEIKEDTK